MFIFFNKRSYLVIMSNRQTDTQPTQHRYNRQAAAYALHSDAGENVTSAGWLVTLCNPIWHVCSRSGEASC